MVVSGSGWPAGTSLSASVCGADAIAGTADCAQTTTVTVVAPRTGRIWVLLTPALPPKPCPCVILISGVTSQYTKKIPVTVVGETTAPVPQPAPATVEPDFQVANLHVAGGVTLASAFGGAAPRTVEFQVSNVGTLTETPVLVGRWGTGNKINNVIKMPTLQEVAAGKSVAVRAHFSLPALSMGSYTVKVFVQVVGFHNVASDSATTSTWPFALFIALLVLLELLLLAITKIVRTRRRRAAGPGGVDSAQTPNGGGPGSGPQNANGLVDLGAKVGAAAGVAGVVAGEVHDPSDPTTHLE